MRLGALPQGLVCPPRIELLYFIDRESQFLCVKYIKYVLSKKVPGREEAQGRSHWPLVRRFGAFIDHWYADFGLSSLVRGFGSSIDRWCVPAGGGQRFLQPQASAPPQIFLRQP